MADKVTPEEFQELLAILKVGMEEQFAKMAKMFVEPVYIDTILTAKQQQNFFDSCDRQMEQLVGAASAYRWNHPEVIHAPVFEDLRRYLDESSKKELSIALRPGEKTLFGRSVALVLELENGNYVWLSEVDELLSREAHARAMTANAIEELARGLSDPEAKATALLAAEAHRNQAANPTLMQKVIGAKNRAEVAQAICDDKASRSQESGLGKMMELVLTHPFKELRQEMGDQLTPEQLVEAEKVMRQASESCKPHIETFLMNLLGRWRDRFS